MLAAYAEVEGSVRCRPRRVPAAAQGVVRDRAPAAERRSRASTSATTAHCEALVTAAFSHRRKTLRNGLKGLLSGEDIGAAASIRNCAPKRSRRSNSDASPPVLSTARARAERWARTQSA